MSVNNKDKDKQEIINEYETKKVYYDTLRDDITNLQKSIADMKASIKNTINVQESLKTANYNIWQQLEDKTTQTKTTEKEPDITDILDSFK